MVVVLVGEPALFGCLHEQLTPVDVPERKDRIDCHVLEAAKGVAGLRDSLDRARGRRPLRARRAGAAGGRLVGSGLGPQVGHVSPVGDIVDAVVEGRRSQGATLEVHLVLFQEDIRRNGVGITVETRGRDRVKATYSGEVLVGRRVVGRRACPVARAMGAVRRVGIVLECRRDVVVTQRLAIREEQYER